MLKNTMNQREYIFLAATLEERMVLSNRKSNLYLDSRDFNSFSKTVKDVIGDECSTVYTDLAYHIGSIVVALWETEM